MGNVNSPELDPSPARSGDDARRLGCGKVATQRGLVGANDLGGEVPREPKDEVARLLHRFGPPTPENDGRGAYERVEGALGRLSDVDRVASAECLLHLNVCRAPVPDDDDVRETLGSSGVTWFGFARRVPLLDFSGQAGVTRRLVLLAHSHVRHHGSERETNFWTAGTGAGDHLGRRPGGNIAPIVVRGTRTLANGAERREGQFVIVDPRCHGSAGTPLGTHAGAEALGLQDARTAIRT
jgi:hypothetical protein